MLRRLFALALAFGLFVPVLATAKPPDLPLQLEDEVAPVVSPWQQQNDQLMPLLSPLVPVQAILLPSVRKQVAGCLLFAAHPLMPLVPTDKVLDRPCDHPACKPVVRTEPAPEPGTVLYNLTKLVEADDLYKKGDAALKAGRLGEAIVCFEQAAACCPGSTSALAAQSAVHKVFAGIYRGVVGGSEEAEPKKVEQAAPAPVNNQPKAVPQEGLKKKVPAAPLRPQVEDRNTIPQDGFEESDEPWWFPLWWHDSI